LLLGTLLPSIVHASSDIAPCAECVPAGVPVHVTQGCAGRNGARQSAPVFAILPVRVAQAGLVMGGRPSGVGPVS